MNNLQNNAHFAHGENILLIMLADDDESIRGPAVDKVLKMRQHENNTGCTDGNMSFSANMTKVCKFRTPKIDFNMQSHDTLINIDEECMTVPPPLLHIDDNCMTEPPGQLKIKSKWQQNHYALWETCCQV